MLNPIHQPDRQAVASSAFEARDHLSTLSAERAWALATGSAFEQSDLDAAHDAYVGAAVTEIAMLRAALSGPLHG